MRTEVVSSAAILVPKEAESQPKLFIDEGARQSLERKLTLAHMGKAVVLSITNNNRSIITHVVQNGVLYARVHHMFLAASGSVIDALVTYLTQEKAPEANRIVDTYIAGKGAKFKKKQIHVDAEGDHHDLNQIYEELNAKYFNGCIQAMITWGRRSTRKPKDRINLGSYLPEGIIRINRVLDQGWVPKYFVKFVVFHEMLHQVFPSCDVSHRRSLHPPEFMEEERKYPGYEKAIAWESKNTWRFLRRKA